MSDPVRMENGDLHQSTLRVDGKAFRCDCGCNVFHQPKRENLNIYECNSCGTRYETEAKESP